MSRKIDNNVNKIESKCVLLEKKSYSPLVYRIFYRLMTILRKFYWRFSFSSFGKGSSIDWPAYIVNSKSIQIGRSVHIWRYARIEALSFGGLKCIVIDDGTIIQPYVHIGAVESVHIGKGVLIASRVYITDHDHDFSNPDDPPIFNQQLIVAPVQIGDYVWLGEGVSVLKGVKIGERSIIGAGSVVTHNIPAYCLAVGVPARVIRRFDIKTKQWFKV